MKKRKYIIFFIIILLFLFTYFISYKITINKLPDNILSFLIFKYQDSKKINNIDMVSIVLNEVNVNKSFINDKKEVKKEIVYNEQLPIVYIYNTHSDEEYSYEKNNSYNIIPTVKEANYILESELKKLGILSVIEQNQTTKIVNERNLPYSSSYKVSRELLENKKIEYPSLTFFIDLHRDSVERNITTVEINGKTYAKTMFLLGLDNPKYEDNKQVMTSLNNYLDSNYKGLSRGIYEKKGKGVNGVYNQDFNKNTILIEVGGVDNTIEEVSNSLKVIAECLYEYINSTKIE